MSKLSAKELGEVLADMAKSKDVKEAEQVLHSRVSEETQLPFIEPIFKVMPLATLDMFVEDFEQVFLKAEAGEVLPWGHIEKNAIIKRLVDRGDLRSLIDGRTSHHQEVMAMVVVASIESLAENLRA